MLQGPRPIELTPTSTLTASTWRPSPKFKADLKRVPISSTRRYISSDAREGKAARNQVPLDFAFSDRENNILKSTLAEVRENPYSAYADFEKRIESIIASDAISDRFHKMCEQKRGGDLFEDPFVYMTNCPVDDELPKLSFDTPIADKRNLKKTYVAEGFLLPYAKMM